MHNWQLHGQSRSRFRSLHNNSSKQWVHRETSHLPARWWRRCGLQRRRLRHFHILDRRPLEGVGACRQKGTQDTHQAATSTQRAGWQSSS